MTEQQQTTEAPTPDESGSAAPTPEAQTETPAVFADTYKVKVPEGNKGSGRFAVYDKALERYVGNVQDSKPSSTDAKKLVGDHSYTIVEV